MKSLLFIFISIFLFSCQSNGDTSAENSPQNQIHNQLIESEVDSGWQLLFDGVSTDGWRNYKSDLIEGWTAEDGVLKTDGGNGDIISLDKFSDFELTVEWKIKDQGNSGIFYFVVENDQVNRIHETGPEFQIIDENNYPIDLQPNQVTGSLSDVYAPKELASNPPGQWNSTRIIVKDTEVQHWLNETLILKYTMDTPEWEQAIEESKFDSDHYAKVRTGHLAFQDHGDPVAYRNIKIREL
jgi:hypothetical protein